MLKIYALAIIFTVIVIPAASAAANDSMDVQDILDVEPALPFGGELFSMLFGLVKWGAIAGFIVGLFALIFKGSISSAMDNADMTEKSQNNLFNLAKIVLLGAVIYLLGTFTFNTFL